jgi:hypothetical protein
MEAVGLHVVLGPRQPRQQGPWSPDSPGSGGGPGGFVVQILVTLLGLALLVGVGVVVIVMIRSRLVSADDRGDWEKTLVDYKNLRDEGVLSDEEYRKIRTLVEPRMRVGKLEAGLRGMPDTHGDRRSSANVVGFEQERN